MADIERVDTMPDDVRFLFNGTANQEWTWTRYTDDQECDYVVHFNYHTQEEWIQRIRFLIEEDPCEKR